MAGIGIWPYTSGPVTLGQRVVGNGNQHCVDEETAFTTATLEMHHGHPDLPDGSLVELDVDQGLYEVGGFYRPGGQENGFDVLAGVRLLQLDDALTVTLPIGASDTEKSHSSLTDGFIGVRYSDRLSNRLGYQIRIDFASGDTDSTWNTVAGLTVGVGKKGNKNLIFGYRRLDFDLKDQEVESQLEMSGPFFAFNVGF